MATITHDKNEFIIPDKISKKDKEFILGDWIETINNARSLETSQKSLLDLLKKQDKSDNDILMLKAFIKSEKFNYDKINTGRLLVEKMEKDLISSFKKAILDKNMVNNELSYKQVLQKMVDDKLVGNADLYTDFLKTAPDVEAPQNNNVANSDNEVDF